MPCYFYDRIIDSRIIHDKSKKNDSVTSVLNSLQAYSLIAYSPPPSSLQPNPAEPEPNYLIAKKENFLPPASLENTEVTEPIPRKFHHEIDRPDSPLLFNQEPKNSIESAP